MPTAVVDSSADLVECGSCSARTDSIELVATVEDKVLCTVCVTELELCQGCDRPAADTAPTTSDTLLCGDCLQGWSKCEDCDRYSAYIVAIISGGDVCSACSLDYSRCEDCGLRTNDPYTINNWRDVCSDCRTTYRECDLCETLVPSDEDYCDDCLRPEHDWVYDCDYKPDPDFHGDGPLFLGLELELHCETRGFRQSVETADPQLGELGYLKQDGSISCGFEMVTHPMSFDYAMANFPWSLLSRLRLLGCYTDESAGIHIHLSRAGFDSPAHIYRWLKLIYRNEPAVTALARRRHTQWASFDPDIRAMAKQLAHGDHGWGRYHAVNARPTDTFELRVFASSLKPQQVQAALAFAHASVEYTRGLRARDVTRGGWDWSTFTTWVSARPEYAPLTAELTALTATGAFTDTEQAYPCAS